MSEPRCLLVGAGRLAGGYVAPLLRAAGWKPTLVCRNREVLRSINEGCGLWVRIVGVSSEESWVGGIAAVSPGDKKLPRLAVETDLIATAVGPSSLKAVGRMLAPLLRMRLEACSSPVNIITFENHRRGSELLTLGMLEERPDLAREIGRRIGVGGAAAWRAVSTRELTPSGLRFHANREHECYVDAASLIPGVAPLDGSLPGLTLVRAFDDRIVEKLWTFNAGHAAAAYFGWHAGCKTLDEAMSRPGIRDTAASVVREAR